MIDARIPLGGQPVQLQSPFEAMGQIAQLQQVRDLTEARRLAAEKARQEAQDAAQVRRILTESGGDLDKALPGLMTANPVLALKLQADREEARQKALLATKTQLDVRTQGITAAANLASLVVADPSRGPVVRDYLKNLSKEVEPILPPDDTPESWQTFSNLALSGMERANLAQAELKLLIEGKATEAVSSSLYRAVDQADWDKKLAGFRPYVPQAILDQFPTTYSPQNVKLAGQLGITPEKQATLDAAAARDAQAAAHQAALEANAAAQLGISRGNLAVNQAAERRLASMPRSEELVKVVENGVEVWRPRSQAAGQRAGGDAASKSTEGERKAAGFYTQMQQALSNINRLEANLTDTDLYQIQSLPQEGFMGALNRGAMSDAAKQYIQAFNQFTEARLRPVSGAAIADSEYARDRATYGKQYAETTDLAAQRKAARKSALDSLRVMGGSAVKEQFAVTAPNGKTYTFNSAAELAAFKKRAGIP